MRKKLTTIIIFLVLISKSSSANPGDEDLYLINGMGISLSLNDENQKQIFSSAEYSNEYEFILLETHKEINYIQLINNRGEVERKIEVDSKHVQIGKKVFNKGRFLLAFKLEGTLQIEFINVNVE